jgi:hypothetical protein
MELSWVQLDRVCRPSMGCLASHFIGQGEGTGYMRERGGGGKGFLGSHRPSPRCAGPAGLVDDDGDGSTLWHR